MRVAPWLVLCALLAACSSRPQPSSPSDVALVEASGDARAFQDLVARAPLTVVVFVAKDCPCLDAHLARLRELAAAYGPRGVQFLAVDSEVGATPARAKETERDLALPFPVLVDDGARLADALGAEYATFTVVIDRAMNVRYRGGIDSDKRKLHPDATHYVRDALDDLLAGRAPRRTEGKALGCVLRRW